MIQRCRWIQKGNVFSGRTTDCQCEEPPYRRNRLLSIGICRSFGWTMMTVLVRAAREDSPRWLTLHWADRSAWSYSVFFSFQPFYCGCMSFMGYFWCPNYGQKEPTSWLLPYSSYAWFRKMSIPCKCSFSKVDDPFYILMPFELPVLMNYLRNRHVAFDSYSFYRFWISFNYSLNTFILFFNSYLSIERYLLIFHHNAINKEEFRLCCSTSKLLPAR